MNTVAERAIARSVSHNEIVTLDFDTEANEELQLACEDAVVANGVTEYWGTTESGDDWRVHVRRAPLESVSGVNDDDTERTLRVGDRVTCDADGGDAGRIGSFIDSETAMVYWDSGVATPVAVSDLRSEVES